MVKNKTVKVLTKEALEDYLAFDESYSCSCHINPPCSKCTDSGNPLNLLEDDTAWEEISEEMYNNSPEEFETFETLWKKVQEV